jgi:hypothetical protein
MTWWTTQLYLDVDARLGQSREENRLQPPDPRVPGHSDRLKAMSAPAFGRAKRLGNSGVQAASLSSAREIKKLAIPSPDA